MRMWVLLLLAVWLAACSNDEVAGFTTVETQNALLIQIVGADSVPVKGALARIRATDYYTQNDARNDDTGEGGVIASFESDSRGFIAVEKSFLDTLSVKSVALEIRDSVQGTFQVLDVSDLKGETEDTLQYSLYRLQRLKGKIESDLSGGVILLYGTDKFALLDSAGNFVIEGVAPGDYSYAVESRDSVVAKGSVHVHEYSVDNLCETLECTETRLNLVLKDTAQTDTLEDVGYVEIINFENGFGGGYFATSDSTVVSTPTPETSEEGFEDAGAGREGTAYHWKSSAPLGRWAFFGKWICAEDDPCDLSALDSVEFYIRGTGRYSFSFESLGDANYKGKALFYDTLKVDSENGRDDAETWKRVAITPADFVEGDSSWGNLGWDLIHDKITNIAVSAYGDAEIWLDDIKLYGIKPEDLK